MATKELEQQLYNWHIANLEFANATCVENLSLAHWDQDDPWEMAGDHCFLPGGNTRLVAALAEGVPIFYKARVSKVAYGQDGVVVTAKIDEGETQFCADACLCTIPLGVLKVRWATWGGMCADKGV